MEVISISDAIKAMGGDSDAQKPVIVAQTIDDAKATIKTDEK